MTQNKAAFTLIVLVALLSLSTAAVAPALKFTFKNVTANSSALETDTYAINDAGAIAGDYLDSASIQHGMILKGKKLTTVDNSKCSAGIAFYGINSSGVAAGWCTGTSGFPIGFTYAKGKFTSISIKAATDGVEANGINDKGQVVGTYFDSADANHAFVLTGKKLTTLSPPGVSSGAAAWSINDAGVITVYGFNSSGDYISFTTADNGKTYKSFAYKGASSVGTVIHAINNNGDIDGTYFDSNSEGKGVLFHAKKYYAFHDPNDCLAAPCSTRADGLNDTLGIVGRYSPSSAANVGYFAQAK